MDTTRVNTDVLSGIVQHHGLFSHLSEKESPWQEDSVKLTRTTCFDPPPFHRCQSGHQRQCQSHRRWCYSIGSLEIMSLWLPRRYWIRAWEPVWRRAVQQYSSRVQSTEYRREGTAAACWSERQRLQRLEITTRLWSNALVNSDSMQIKGGDMKYLRVIQKFTFDTLWPDPWPMLPQFQWRIYNLFL